MMLCNANLLSGMLPVRGHRRCTVRHKAKTRDVVNRRNMLAEAGIKVPQTDTLLEDGPATADKTLEYVTLLDPIIDSLNSLKKSIDKLESQFNSKIDKLDKKEDSNMEKVLTRMNMNAGVLVLVLLVAIPKSPVVKALQGIVAKLLTK